MDKILIATIIRPQGLNGELKCKLENENYNIIKNITEVYLNDKRVPTKVLDKHYRCGYLYLKLSMCNNREKAEIMRNFKVFVNRSDIDLPKDEYMITDLINMDVISESGDLIGKLLDVQNFGAGDILIVESGSRQCRRR